MKTRNVFLLLALLAALFIAGCAGKYDANPVCPNGKDGGRDTTIIINPPQPGMDTCIVKDVDLAVSPGQNDDAETIYTGFAKPTLCMVSIYVTWGFKSKNIAAFGVGTNSWTVSEPMNGVKAGWITLGLALIGDKADLTFAVIKGNTTQPDYGSDKTRVIRVSQVQFCYRK